VISAAGTKRVECSAKISPAKAGQPGRVEATVPTSTILAAAHSPKGQVITQARGDALLERCTRRPVAVAVLRAY
jgi:hypothetical protein